MRLARSFVTWQRMKRRATPGLIYGAALSEGSVEFVQRCFAVVEKKGIRLHLIYMLLAIFTYIYNQMIVNFSYRRWDLQVNRIINRTRSCKGEH